MFYSKTNPRSIILFLSSLCLVSGYLPNAPSYEEYLTMAGASMQGAFSKNNYNLNRLNSTRFKSPFHDNEGSNYLEQHLSPKELSKKLSKDPSVRERVRRLLKIDMCALIQPNVSLECCSNMKDILMAVSKNQSWALQVIDAFGKIPSGVLQGNIFFGGAYDECLTTTVPKGTIKNPFQPKYCQINFPTNNIMFPAIKYAVCVPNSCTSDEIQFMFNEGVHLLPARIRPNLTTYVTCPEKQSYTGIAIFSLVVSSFFIALLFFATLYDVIFIRLDWQPKWTTSEEEKDENLRVRYESAEVNTLEFKDDMEKILINSNLRNQNIFQEFLLCFSICKNASKLFKTDVSPGTLTSVHGIRFISMTWVILGHSYVFGVSVWSNSKAGWELMSRFTFQAIGNATVSVDTFFLLSGLLVVYGVMQAMQANDGNMNWVYYYFHRFWRLTPAYMLVMMVYVPLFQYWGDGPYWPVNGIEKDYCKDSWWYNLLYINNFKDQECMAWTWYLANDMQFYVISPIMLVFLYNKPKIGFGILSALMLAQLIASGVIMKVNHYTGLLSPGFFNDVYVKPYTRIGSYLVGMIYGYLLFKTKGKMKLNQYIVAMLWLFATICAVSVLYGLYDTYHGSILSENVFAFYTSVHRIVWTLAVGWVIFACVNGYGGYVNTFLSWKPLIPLSRLTYCTYLVHPIVMESFYLSSRYPIYLTDFTAIYLFFGHVVMSFMAAFVVSMAFEAPMIAVENMFRRKK